MRIVERFTRDRASRFVWGGLTVVVLVGLLFSLREEQRALDGEIAGAAERSARSANTVVYDLVGSPSLSSTDAEFRFRDMLVAVQAAVFTDPTVARMRLWDVDGVLRFSTDQSRTSIGTLQVEDARVIDAARDGRSTVTQTTEPFTQATTGRDGEPTRLLQTFVPLRVPDRLDPLGAVQIDYFYERFVENAREPWLQAQVLLAGLLGLFALLTVLSLRTPLKRTASAQVAAAPPRGTPAPETDDAETAALRDELALAREQLTQAEEGYRLLEDRLKEARSNGAMSAEAEQRIATAENERALAEARATRAEERLKELEGQVASLTSQVAEAARVREERPSGADGSDRGPTPAVPERSPHRPAPGRQPEPVGATTADSDAASELRARLARTAARKKLGPNVGD